MANQTASRVASIILSLVLLSSSFAYANSIAKVKLEDLFRQADFVAIVKVLSADGEHYGQTAVYKAQVVRAFKGALEKETIYFGPHTGGSLDSEYLIFARKSEGIRPDGDANAGFGAIPVFYRTMYSGFGQLEIDYVCVFDGKEIKDQCDHGMKLTPSQIILPKELKTFPKKQASDACESVIELVANYQRWVRRSWMVEQLEWIKQTEKH
jgi:hypothetical protein